LNAVATRPTIQRSGGERGAGPGNQRMKLLPSLLVSCALLLIACSRQAESPVPAAAPPPEAARTDAVTEDPALDAARAAAQAFGGRLREALGAAMQSVGPIGAIDVCHRDAPAIAAAVMAEQDVRLGRMSVPGRNRHPEQDAGGWQADVLDAFSRAVAAGAPAGEQVHVARDESTNVLRFARGIETEPVCLACHGTTIAPAVEAAIAERYPEDRATGFAIGDLRGLLWVEVPLPAAPPGIP
jgi:hypothetical protein